jgi:hypothetical protein
VYRVLVGEPEGKNHWGDPDVDGGMVLRWIFMKGNVCVWIVLSWLRIGTGNEYSGSIKCRVFIDWLQTD